MQNSKKIILVIAAGAAIPLLLYFSASPHPQHQPSSPDTDHTSEADDPVDSRDSAHPDVLALLPPPPDAIFDRMLSGTAADIANKKFSDAVKTVVAVSTIHGMSPEQVLRLKNTILNLKIGLAEAASSGDTNALAAIDYFRQHSALGR